MVICIDTNAVLGIFTEGHDFRPIFHAWFSGRLHWAVSTEILLEYEEILQQCSGARKASAVFRVFELVDALHHNVFHVEPAFRFNLITHDPDDNKFSDAAIAASADFILTEDNHFQAMIGSGHKPQPITPLEFIAKHLTAPQTTAE